MLTVSTSTVTVPVRPAAGPGTGMIIYPGRRPPGSSQVHLTRTDLVTHSEWYRHRASARATGMIISSIRAAEPPASESR